MKRRPEPPDTALKVRAAGAVILVASYATFRVPTLASGVEAALTFAGAIACFLVFERAVTQLADRRHHRRQRVESIRNAVTEVFATPVRWPDEIENSIATSRHEATHALVDRGQLSEYLFTHDVLCEPTPPRGLPYADLIARLRAEGVDPHPCPPNHAMTIETQRRHVGGMFGEI